MKTVKYQEMLSRKEKKLCVSGGQSSKSFLVGHLHGQVNGSIKN